MSLESSNDVDVRFKTFKFSILKKYLLGVVLLILSNSLWNLDNIAVQILTGQLSAF